MSRANFIDEKDQGPRFPDLSFDESSFKFGLETEYIIAQADSLIALTYEDITFKQIETIIEQVKYDDLPGDFSVLGPEAPMKKISPVIVEGYGLVDKDFKTVDMLPKGIELRSSVCSSIEECLYVQKKLFERTNELFQKEGYTLLALSHHPSLKNFRGPQNKRRYDWWQWAMQVMTTYGPDINISVPTHLLQDFDLEDFEAKVNYYGPALAALSCASPVYDQKLWEGVSMRTHKRSIVAPAIEYHGDEANRFEFKLFDMSPNLYDYEAYFLSILNLILNKNLKGRCDKATRIYELGEVAKYGLQTPGIMFKLEDFFLGAQTLLLKHGFKPQQLQRLFERMKKRETLANQYKKLYQQDPRKLYEKLTTLDENPGFRFERDNVHHLSH